MQKYVKLCKVMRNYAKLYTIMRNYAKICKILFKFKIIEKNAVYVLKILDQTRQK